MIKSIEFNGERLKNARLYRGKTITELAEETKISKQAISQFENGKSAPSIESLLKIMNVLKFPREYFRQMDKDITVNTFFRSLLTTSKKEQLIQVTRTKTLAKIYEFLEEYIDFPELKILSIDTEELDVEKITLGLREYWGLGNNPIINIVNIMEKNGIVVSSFKTNESKIDAFTQIHKVHNIDRPFVVVGDDKESAVRRQFSMAHELGHIILHNNSIEVEELSREEYKIMEEEANNFAAALLMPKNSFLADVMQYPNKLEYYIELKKKWKVSISAMIIRAFKLNAITYNQYQYLMKQLSKKGWRVKEPLDDLIVTPKPVLLKRAIDMLTTNDVMNETEIVSELSNYGMALNADDIEMLLSLDKGRLRCNDTNNNIVINLKREQCI
ncbi:helix-turn-helix domain-containing protein [Clostridium butyricum]|uniref:helix-turn-helix domain-containing protein n=1 Tax=Clostridium butyricum TaxID=1492 RepID=UPI0005EB409F|nr:XRE family transcriptional regulator [Clostridium butyricum]